MVFAHVTLRREGRHATSAKTNEHT
jgi:hypothetical protein